MKQAISKAKKYLQKWMPKRSEQLQEQVFFAKGAKPWTEGYQSYKWKTISSIIRSGNFNSMIGTERFGYRIDERVVEIPWLVGNLPEGPCTMLDAGSALNFEPVIMDPRMSEKKLFISTLAPEGQAFWSQGVSYVYEDLRESCYRDAFFDYIACISTLEHVGLDNTFLYSLDQTKKEANEDAYFIVLDSLRRVLKPGGHLFLSMPFGSYKNHGWFQVFNASMIDDLVRYFAPTSYTETVFMYEADRWSKVSRDAARDAICYDINVDKTYAPDYCAFSRAVVCLDLVK